MKIILRKDHELLGNAGDQIEVKDGYARNYLIPNGYAAASNTSNIKQYEEVRRQQSRKLDKQKQEAQQLSDKLNAEELHITVKAGEEDKLFGSVTSQNIFDALTEKGYTTIDKRKIILKDPIRTLGEHTVAIKLFGDIYGNVKVHVDKEGGHHEEASQETTGETQPQETLSEQPASEEQSAE